MARLESSSPACLAIPERALVGSCARIPNTEDAQSQHLDSPTHWAEPGSSVWLAPQPSQSYGPVLKTQRPHRSAGTKASCRQAYRAKGQQNISKWLSDTSHSQAETPCHYEAVAWIALRAIGLDFVTPGPMVRCWAAAGSAGGGYQSAAVEFEQVVDGAYESPFAVDGAESTS